MKLLRIDIFGLDDMPWPQNGRTLVEEINTNYDSLIKTYKHDRSCWPYDNGELGFRCVAEVNLIPLEK